MDHRKLTPTKYPNLFNVEGGRLYVRAKIKDPTTDKIVTLTKTFPEGSELVALQWLKDERERVQSGVALPAPQKTRFSEFAADLLEDKIKLGDIRSAKGKEKWRYTLEHLIVGRENCFEGFGDMYIHMIDATHVDQWKLNVAGLITSGEYSPVTVNGWISILRVIMKAAKRKYKLAELATEDLTDFDTSEHATYTEEEPNALLPNQVPPFLALMEKQYPQFYAMAFLGFATGLRPSSLRALRRRGPESDVLWDKNRILIRRSVTLNTVMNTTKQKKRYAVDLPDSAMHVLRWHVRNQLATPQQEDSDLLFPSIYGGYRASSVLNGPFADVCRQLKLPPFSQKGLRRTFNDLARAAKVQDLITRSISGHLTEKMQEHYSTASAQEQREGIGKVIQLFGEGRSNESHPGGSHAPDVSSLAQAGQ